MGLTEFYLNLFRIKEVQLVTKNTFYLDIASKALGSFNTTFYSDTHTLKIQYEYTQIQYMVSLKRVILKEPWILLTF